MRLGKATGYKHTSIYIKYFKTPVNSRYKDNVSVAKITHTQDRKLQLFDKRSSVTISYACLGWMHLEKKSYLCEKSALPFL